MMVHRSGALILMAVLLLAMAAGPASAPAASRGSHDHAGVTGMLALLAVTGTIVFVAGTCMLIMKLLSRTQDRDVLSGVEAGSMGLSLGLMRLAEIV